MGGTDKLSSDVVGPKERLGALVEQWKHLDGFINATEARYNTVLMVLVTLLTAGNFYVAGRDTPADSRGWVSVAFIFISCTVVSYLEHEFRRVAALRGLLQQIEHRINDLLGEKDFEWNSRYVPPYVGRSWTNWALSITLGFALGGVLAWTYYAVINAFGWNARTIALLVYVAIILTANIIMLFGNQAVIEAVARGEVPEGTSLSLIHTIARGVLKSIKERLLELHRRGRRNP
ncbi:hypothetical protein H6A23_05690 [Olsenella uli]|uniref:hypothetical protein n=1 Tax=Olsenella uli TaxID=133926 RepID=UPI001959C7B3|nr:hypothetical protein [Olsenella uli]MBM6816656.1 hypothetical protein [Olsenella uli]